MATFTAGAFGADFDLLSLASLAAGQVQNPSSTNFIIQSGPELTRVFGSGFSFGGNGFPVSGFVDHLAGELSGVPTYDLLGFSLSSATFVGWITTGADFVAKTTILAGADLFNGSSFADRMRGYGGDDTLNGGGGNDYLDGGAGDDDVFAGLGDDTVVDSAGANYLRGDEGDDFILGGFDFDDINGNMGNDTCEGGPGDDWVVGGKDNDVLYGADGGDLVLGNLGDDTCDGGAGADVLRGGQSNDSLSGGAGSDYLSGDRGDDTVSGGSGADNFHAFGDAGLDRVTDFSVAEGDRVQLDPGSAFTVSQVGSDTVVSITGGAQVILVGVSMSSLLSSSIFVG